MKKIVLIALMFILVGCGSSVREAEKNQDSLDRNVQTPIDKPENQKPIKKTDPKYLQTYKGLRLYAKSMSVSEYKLAQVDDTIFNALSNEKKLIVANKLLSAMFFGYPLPKLKERINRGDFISTIQDQIRKNTNDRANIEETLLDKDLFFQSKYANDEVNKILARFYMLKYLDKYYFENWMSYILTQTIMFSPAYELPSSAEPNIERVYSALVRDIQDESTISYTTYLHMMSNDNWRRFRSPEDNGREMLEIFALNFDDKLVPIAATALQNWKLDLDNDTLVIGLNENTKPLKMFGTVIYTGEDFYRELAKSKDLQIGVVTRVVDYLFTSVNQNRKKQIIDAVIKSNPQTWQDIFVQLLFSKAFLFDSNREKSAEELFYSLIKKMSYKHYKYSFYNFKKALDAMNQATMRYKLGKLKRVPLDTLSFMNYHKFIREKVMIRAVNSKKLDNYLAWDSQGWRQEFISDDKFEFFENSPEASLESFINYLFETTISRKAKQNELELFKAHILSSDKSKYATSSFDLKKLKNREYVAIIILDYISRLSELYQYKKVRQCKEEIF